MRADKMASARGITSLDGLIRLRLVFSSLGIIDFIRTAARTAARPHFLFETFLSNPSL